MPARRRRFPPRGNKTLWKSAWSPPVVRNRTRESQQTFRRRRAEMIFTREKIRQRKRKENAARFFPRGVGTTTIAWFPGRDAARSAASQNRDRTRRRSLRPRLSSAPQERCAASGAQAASTARLPQLA